MERGECATEDLQRDSTILNRVLFSVQELSHTQYRVKKGAMTNNEVPTKCSILLHFYSKQDVISPSVLFPQSDQVVLLPESYQNCVRKLNISHLGQQFKRSALNLWLEHSSPNMRTSVHHANVPVVVAIHTNFQPQAFIHFMQTI